MRSFWIAFVVVSLSLFAQGCGSSADGCSVVCAKNAECQLNTVSEATCLQLCKEQSKDEAYAEAIERQGDCYEEEDWSCAELAGGVCNYSE